MHAQRKMTFDKRGHFWSSLLSSSSHFLLKSTMAPQYGLSPRPKRTNEPTMTGSDRNTPNNTRKRVIRPVQGLSRARIASGRLLLRLRANPRNTLLFPALGVVLFILIVTLLENIYVVRQTTNSSLRIPAQAKTSFIPGPRVVQMHNESLFVSKITLDYHHSLEERQNKYWLDHGTSQYKSRSHVKEGCVALADWQEGFHPSCNAFHEVSMSELVHPEGGWELLRLINNGAYRDVWGIRDYDGERRVLKTLRYQNSRKFDLRNFDRHRRDAVASEQLSASPHIVDIYGYCANSALTDYCDGGDLFDVRELRNPTKNDLLRIAYDVAASVADAHHYDDQGRATIAHTDLKPNQWIYLNGRYQLNDFNRCRFMTWSTDKDEPCGFEVARNGGVWRAPEEYLYKKETEKLDVFSLGNVLYFLLTDNVPFDDMDSDDAYEFVANGGRVIVKDKEILNSTHLFDTTLLKAMDMCFVYDPKERATAREVAEFIKGAVGRIEEDTEQR